jgi:hypothetical protein
MATRKVHWTQDSSPEPTRKKSGAHEKSIVKKFGGRLTSNSGASFGENDIKTDMFDIEAKITDGEGYRITAAELIQIRNKSTAGRIPAQIIKFNKYGTEYIILSTADFLDLSGLDMTT